MKDIIFTKDCEFNGKSYFIGDSIKLSEIKEKDLKNIWTLNERGFIEPILYKDFVKFKQTLKNPINKYRKDDISE